MVLVFVLIDDSPRSLRAENLANVSLPSRVEFLRENELYSLPTDWTYFRNESPIQLAIFQKALWFSAPRKNIYLAGWDDTKSGSYVEAAVIEYKSPFVATISFYLNNPSYRYYGGPLWNFTYDRENISQPEWQIESEANSQSVQCGDGNSDLCSEWFYRARYGRFFLIVEFKGGANLETFSKTIEEILSEVELP